MPTPLSALRYFLLDMDGTLYLGQRLLPGAREFLERLTATGRRYVLLTNNSSLSALEYEQKVQRLRLPITAAQILTSGEATARWLVAQGYRTIYALGTPQFEAELDRAGLRRTADGAEAVVLGFDKTLTYAKLETAGHLLRQGVPFIASHPDLVCPTEQGPIPDTGSMIALLTTATGAQPTVIGKPHRRMVEMALAKLGVTDADEWVHAAMVGDRLYTDMRMAVDAGITSILVLSGETQPADLEGAAIRPDHVFADVAGLCDALG